MEGIFLLVMFAMLIVFDIAARKWGYDSTDKIDSPEWERRSSRRAFL